MESIHLTQSTTRPPIGRRKSKNPRDLEDAKDGLHKARGPLGWPEEGPATLALLSFRIQSASNPAPMAGGLF